MVVFKKFISAIYYGKNDMLSLTTQYSFTEFLLHQEVTGFVGFANRFPLALRTLWQFVFQCSQA